MATKSTIETKEPKQKLYRFHIHEHTPYWETGNITVTASSRKEAIQKALDGEYDHLGDNEIDLNTMGSSVVRELYAESEGKVLGHKIHGVILNRDQMNTLKLLLRCADSDLEGLLKETCSDAKHPANTTRKEIRQFFKAVLRDKV